MSTDRRWRGHGRTPVPSPISAPSHAVPATSPAVSTLDGMQLSTLDNGIQVLSERISGVRSAAVGVWIRQGAAHETASNTGVSHLLEHMVFKGTEKRSALEIADSLEGLGGSLDAYTSREHTSYQGRILDEHLPEAMDVLSDMVLAPRIEASDLDLEREVVLEEIAQVEDTPDDIVFELHSERVWGDHPYGRSILGTKESVRGMAAGTLQTLHSERYVGRNLVIAAAGNVEHGDVVERVESLFGQLGPGDRTASVALPNATTHGLQFVERDSAQTHIVFGAQGPGHAHDDRYPLVLLSSALGGGMSSRLFQRVREELGLCYSVFTYQSFYHAAGVLGVYVGTRPATAAQAAEAVRSELKQVADEGLSATDVDRIKRQVKGQVMLSLESTGARLHRLASFALHDESCIGLEEVVAHIDRVTVDDIHRVAARYFDPDRHLELRLGSRESVD
jgi:predicted Zn-dependent peptidase